jgi:hypothetical protein
VNLHDPSIDALDEGTRLAVARHWQHRASSEWAVCESFLLLAEALPSLGSAANDEARHAELCLRVAERYRSSPLALDRRPVELPPWPGVAEEIALVLHVLAMACIEESIACVWLDAQRRAAQSPLVRAALHELLTDETAHAQLGWSFAAALAPTQRAAVEPHLDELLHRTTVMWFEADASGRPEGIPDHGVLPEAESREVIISAVNRVVLPGLARAGIATLRS